MKNNRNAAQGVPQQLSLVDAGLDMPHGGRQLTETPLARVQHDYFPVPLNEVVNQMGTDKAIATDDQSFHRSQRHSSPRPWFESPMR
jgi:hypothetical protein